MASNSVTKEIESRLKQNPEHLFEVFLEIHEPSGNDPPAILIQYPPSFSNDILKSAANFAYPSPVPTDEQSENFTFVVPDGLDLTFRFGHCRRSNRESTCLCLISYYPWFEAFASILNDLSQLINSRPFVEVEEFLSSLYNYKLLSFDEFYRRDAQERIEIRCGLTNHFYVRPDQRKLPPMLSNRNFSVMFSRLGPEIMLRLFTHLISERRILFVSSKLFHLTACAWSCLYLIYPMHWQSLFLPILPESMACNSQCPAPFIIGIHTSVFSKLNRQELGDVIIVNIDEKSLESPYDDLTIFPKDLIRSLRKGIDQSSQMIGDHLARVFLRAMAFIIGNYANGFVIKNNQLDFDRDVFLQQYQQTPLFSFMSTVAHTQMFEQFSRYRATLQLQREVDIDEFDIEVKNYERIQREKKLKSNKRIYRLLEKTTNPLIEQVQDKTEQLQAAISKISLRTSNETSPKIKRSSPSITPQTTRAANAITTTTTTTQLTVPQSMPEQSTRSSTPELISSETDDPLIDLDSTDNCRSPSPIVLEVIQSSQPTTTFRSTIQVNPKIKQIQTELKHKVQNFDGPRRDLREELAAEQTTNNIQQLMQQFDPLENDSTEDQLTNRHPSLIETIPTNHVHQILQTIQSTYGTNSRAKTNSSDKTNSFDLIDLN